MPSYWGENPSFFPALAPQNILTDWNSADITQHALVNLTLVVTRLREMDDITGQRSCHSLRIKQVENKKTKQYFCIFLTRVCGKKRAIQPFETDGWRFIFSLCLFFPTERRFRRTVFAGERGLVLCLKWAPIPTRESWIPQSAGCLSER